jgi:hypothetical protein
MMIENHPFQGTVEAIPQLAVAMASDHHTVTTLISSNAELTLQLKASQAYINKLKEDTAELKLRSNPHDTVSRLPRQRKITTSVGRMAIKCTTNTQAQCARIPRTDTRKRQQGATQWTE